jgi:LysM repeat protein
MFQTPVRFNLQMSPGYAIIEQVFEREAYMTTLAPVAVSPIKLTRRGRMLVSTMSFAAMLAISLVSLFGIATASAKATNETSNSATTQIVVAPGETLWTIAARVNPEIDPRAVIEDIKALNVIEGSEVYAGQVLLIP